jgi:hypothetical protein
MREKWENTKPCITNTSLKLRSNISRGKRVPTAQRMEQVNEKYGLDLFNIDDVINNQYKAASVATQVRGSVNNPRVIRGVDTDEDVNVLFSTNEKMSNTFPSSKENALSSVSMPLSMNPSSPLSLKIGGNDDMILSLLIRFKLLRHAARCFEYILQTSPKWGDVGELKRRSLLVSKLTAAQYVMTSNSYYLYFCRTHQYLIRYRRDEFTDVFRLIDKSGE